MPTDVESLGLTDAEARVLMKRLWKRGFHCFNVARDINPDLTPAVLDDKLKIFDKEDLSLGELAYAVLEFQIYTLWAPRLGVMQRQADKPLLVPSDSTVRTELNNILTASPQEVGSTWNSVWWRCLDIWEKPTIPASDNHGHEGYCCPVRIERLTRLFKKGKPVLEDVSERTELENRVSDRSNVWFGMEADDSGYLFCARDVSNWFQIDSQDSAYVADPEGQAHGYEPPAGLVSPAGLHRRRAFATGAYDTKSKKSGPVITPWEAVEFRPKLLSVVDQNRIKSTARWGGIFRIIRAVAQMESRGSFDCMQAYDRAFLSLPLVHSAASHGETGGPNELGGLLRWLEGKDNHPKAVEQQLKTLRLGARSADWRDGSTDEAAYDTGSGENNCTAAGIVGVIVASSPFVSYADSMEILRRPHMIYRFAMHLRTQPITRHAMWALAVHRLRQIAWLRIPACADLPQAWHERPLGEVVHTEQGMTLLLRYAVKSPGSIFTNPDKSHEVFVASTIGKTKKKYKPNDYALLYWMKQAWNKANGNDAEFQTELINILCGKTPFIVPGGTASTTAPEAIGERSENLSALLNWHTKFPYHLHESEVHDRLSLSAAAGSSPFVIEENKTWHLDDARDAWWAAADGHPPPAHAPTYLVPASLAMAAKGIGIAPTLLGLVGEPGIPGSKKDALEQVRSKLLASQTARELHAVAATGKARARDGRIVETQRAHVLAAHGTYNQRWSRLYLHEFVSKGLASLLLCAASTTRPKPEDALWALDAPQAINHEVYAFDDRDGAGAAALILGRSEVRQKQLHIVSLGNTLSLISPTDELGQLTDRVYKAALGSAVVMDSFAVDQMEDTLVIRLGSLRHNLPINKASQTALGGDIGLFLELLAWRTDVEANPKGIEARFLREAGIGLQARRSKESLFSFKDTRLKVDRLAPTLPLLLSTSRKDQVQTMSNAEFAIWLLSWPALHRFRVLLRKSDTARQAMRDVWRIGLRSILDAPAKDFGLKIPAHPRVFHLFRSEPVLSALAHWVWCDVEGFRKAYSSKPFKVLLTKWLAVDSRKDVNSWEWTDEISVFWDMLLPQLPDSPLKVRLNGLRPGKFDRPRLDTLDKVMDLQGLEGTELPGAMGSSARTGFIVTPLSVGKVGVALFTVPMPNPPAVTMAQRLADGDDFWITGIAPVFNESASARYGASLELPTPVSVKLRAGTNKTTVRVADSGSSVTDDVDLPDGELLSCFDVELDVTAWLGGLGDGVTITLLVAGAIIDKVSNISLGLRLSLPWLRVPFEFPLTEVVSLSDITVNLKERLVNWRRDLTDRDALPFRAIGSIELSMGLDTNCEPKVRFRGRLKQVEVQLGSPVATLKFSPIPETDAFSFDADLTVNTSSLALSAPAKLRASLHLQLSVLAENIDLARVVPTLLSSRTKTDTLLAPFNIDLGMIVVPETAESIRFSTTYPEIPVWMFATAQAVPAVPAVPASAAEQYKLLDVSDSWFGGKVAGLHFNLTDKPIPQLNDNDFSVRIKLAFSLVDDQSQTLAVAGAVELMALCERKGDWLDLSPRSFACKIQPIDLTFAIPPQSRVLHLGDVASLHLPANLHTQLDLSGKGDALNIKDNVELHVPADASFVFDISEMSLGQAGMSLVAAVRHGETHLPGLSGLSESLSVHPAKDGGSGTLRITRGRLISASIKAGARLKFFDDADGVLSLTLYQNGSEVEALATFDLPLGRKFNVRALYLAFQIDSVQLGLRFERGKWEATGGMTGSLAFLPDGALSGRLAEYSSLFDGTQVHFENFDLGKLGKASVRILTTPRTITVAGLFEVVLRGVEIHSLGELSPKSVGLIGDIRLLAKLPDMRVSLTMGDIRLWQPTVDSWIPKIKISSLGLSFAVPSGFEFEGRAVEYDDEQEYGFGGVVRLKTDVFPGIDLMLKLTRIKSNGGDYPSVVVYGSMDRTDSLAYGFFLRRAGVGVAINQGLKGFSDAKQNMPIAQRVEDALRVGIVNPGVPESWVAMKDVDTHTSYSLVAQAQVSYGLMSRDTDHPFMSTMVLMVDDNFDIIAGVNAWLMVSPDDALRQDFIDRPAVRGAIGLSPREQVLYGRFMTMKNAKFGSSVDASVFGRMLRSALEATQLSTSFYCDPRGTLLEVGYPRQAKFNFNLGPVTGNVEAGFRFGYYRGTHVVGMNLAAVATISAGLSGDFGFAEVSLSYKAAFALQGSFAGALTNRGEVYILAELVVSARFDIAVNLRKRINISGFGFSYDITLFDISGSASITASAAVSAALVPDGLGFDGYVTVTLNICGFGFDARLYIASNAGRVVDARRRINELVPPIDEIIRAPQKVIAEVTGAGADAETEDAPVLQGMPTRWCYHVRIVNGATRVAFYPDAESKQGYPVLLRDKNGGPYSGRQHIITLNGTFHCSGVLGRKVQQVGSDLILAEGVNETVIPREHLLSDNNVKATHDLLAGDMLAELVQMKPLEGKEIVDPRTHAPIAGDFDDPGVLADPRRRSTRFRKRHRVSNDDPMTYDDHLLFAQTAAVKPILSR